MSTNKAGGDESMQVYGRLSPALQAVGVRVSRHAYPTVIIGLKVAFVVMMPPLLRASLRTLFACSEDVSNLNALKTDAREQPTSATISSTVPFGTTMHLIIFFCIFLRTFLFIG